jgi:transcriptional regulator with XRE-family HTH domain
MNTSAKTMPSGRSFRRRLGRTIALLRLERGWSQEDMAELLDVPRSRLSKWEAGANGPPPEDQLALSGLLGLTVDEMLRGEEPTPVLEDLDPEASGQVERHLNAILRLLQKVKSSRPEAGSRPGQSRPGDQEGVCRMSEKQMQDPGACNPGNGKPSPLWVQMLKPERVAEGTPMLQSVAARLRPERVQELLASLPQWSLVACGTALGRSRTFAHAADAADYAAFVVHTASRQQIPADVFVAGHDVVIALQGIDEPQFHFAASLG